MLRFRSFAVVLFLVALGACGGDDGAISAMKMEIALLKKRVEKNEEAIRSIPTTIAAQKPRPIVKSVPEKQSPEGQDNIQQALRIVSASLGYNTLKVASSDLQALRNPKGQGVLVYVPKTRFAGVERYVVWMVIDGKAYALNGPTKKVTPDLHWPRDAPNGTWKKTGLDPYQATEAINLVF